MPGTIVSAVNSTHVSIDIVSLVQPTITPVTLKVDRIFNVSFSVQPLITGDGLELTTPLLRHDTKPYLEQVCPYERWVPATQGRAGTRVYDRNGERLL